MEAALKKLNIALQEAIDSFEGPLNQERLNELQTTESLPNKEVWSLASQTIDLADKIIHRLQPPSLQLAESFLAYLDTKCLWAAVSHDIPDLITAGGPQTVQELAKKSGLQSIRLKQVMRVLHNNGIFEYKPTTQKYSNTPSSTLLAKDHWTQWHLWVDLYGNEHYKAAEGIPDAIREGQTRCAAQIQYDTDESMFRYFARNGLQEKFHKTLGAGAVAQAPGMMADYNWGELDDAVVLDIGGGGGDFITSLLREHPSMRGGLFELDSVIEMVRPKYRDASGEFADVGDRMVDLHVGDFRVEVPAYEVYTMKWCLHNWLDEDVVKILSAVRRAIKVTPRARMVVVESVLKDGRSSRIWRFGDLTMMAGANGQEREEEDWRGLAAKTGWNIHSISPLRNAWAAAIDLRPC
uniref:O-methyltransferase verK n=1 Tax=Clonostachys rogersoniana TaxID=122658 RepID=VERM_CLORO|nr:RecName: Full=O-methyltransferase verK; AltName: Full=Verticillin biosynthesis cluster protein M [Clonostachys rogersoniana]AQZ42159.1 putative O-methyltransferase [Gliocladium sp.]